MLEMNCVLNSLEQKFVVGRTVDSMLNYFKAKLPILELLEAINVCVSRYGLKCKLIKSKECTDGNIVLVIFNYDGSWD